MTQVGTKSLNRLICKTNVKNSKQ